MKRNTVSSARTSFCVCMFIARLEMLRFRRSTRLCIKTISRQPQGYVKEQKVP